MLGTPFLHLCKVCASLMNFWKQLSL